ncbi:MAG: glyoxalase [Myxococcales bacterium]|nr:glyoxalase [Myxococcales bacterium]|tara:strand:- start:556 stop:975 length:420 start_codon:yes stop_codon:yes gene_type:complete
MNYPPFHLAFPVRELDATRRFYCTILGCTEGRASDTWIDFNFFGHQLSAHVAPEMCSSISTNAVDGDAVPVRHFGVVLGWSDWHLFVDRLRESGIEFLIEPKIRFESQVGEQATCFLVDPSGNALEFKSFRNPDLLFEA